MSLPDLQQAEAAHQQGDFATASRCYRRVLEQPGGDHAGALYGLGTIASQQNSLEEAQELLSQAVAIAPDAADINFNYALCLHKCGSHEQAVEVALHTAQLCRGDANFSQAVFNLLLDLNQPGAVIKLLEELQHVSTSEMLLLARARGALGEWDKSVAVLRQLFGQHQNNVTVVRELSVAAGKLRDYPLAISSYRHFMGLIRPVAADYLKFADLYLLARDITNSEEQLELAEKAGEDSAEYYYLRARLARLGGDDVNALAYSEAALTRQPTLGQAWQIRVETADPEDLPNLVEQLGAIAARGGKANYQHTLIYYALAEGNRTLGRFGDAATALKGANAIQKADLAQRGREYDALEEEKKQQIIRSQFASINSMAGVLPDQAKPIFIVGMPRSGTTLMEKILSQLPEVTSAGENEALSFIASQYQRDTSAGQLPRPPQMSAQQWQELTLRYYQLTGQQGNYIVDKMPTNFLHAGLILSMFPSAKIIQMRRDPRDVCLSIYARPFPEGHNYACDPEALAHTFYQAQRMMDHWLALDPGRVIDVSFEQLVRDPAAQSQRVSDFCGLPWSEDCLNFHTQHSPSFTFSESQVREAISDKPVGQWRAFANHLPELFAALRRYEQ